MKNVENTEKIEMVKPERPSIEQWERLYAVAAKLKSQEPWERLADTDFVTLKLPGMKEPVFCSVMGNGKQCYGVAVYPGYESFNLLGELLNFYDLEPINPFTFEQKSLLCYYGSREDIDPPDREVMKALGIRFRGRNQWIYFRSVKPGMLPWYLDASNADMLADTLEGLSAAYEQYTKNNIQVNFAKGETLLCSCSEENGEWKAEAAPMPSIPRLYESWSMSDKLMLDRLNDKDKIPMEVEMDTFYMPTPIQENKDETPVLPRLSLVFDRKSGMLLEHDIQTGPCSPAAILNCLFNFIMKHGRPSNIYVRNQRIAHIMENTCDHTGISLSVGKAMPTTDDFLGNMMNFMG